VGSGSWEIEAGAITAECKEFLLSMIKTYKEEIKIDTAV